jgi:hypothetical protein
MYKNYFTQFVVTQFVQNYPPFHWRIQGNPAFVFLLACFQSIPSYVSSSEIQSVTDLLSKAGSPNIFSIVIQARIYKLL